MLRSAIAAALVLCAAPSVVRAHDPRFVTVRYDYDSGMLYVVVDHEVMDPERHFVSEIDVSVNGFTRVYYYDRQSDPDELKLRFKVDAYRGDAINVKAYCSILGSQEHELYLSEFGGLYRSDWHRRHEPWTGTAQEGSGHAHKEGG